MTTTETCFSHYCIYFRPDLNQRFTVDRPIISPRMAHMTLTELTMAPRVRHVWSFVLLGVPLPLLPLTEIFSVVHALTVLYYCILLYYVMQINVVFLISCHDPSILTLCVSLDLIQVTHMLELIITTTPIR